MTIFIGGLVLLVLCLLVAMLAIVSGHIPWLCHLLGGAELEKEQEGRAK